MLGIVLGGLFGIGIGRGGGPRVGYVRGAAALLRFVDRFAGDRMVCCSLNPRPEVFRNAAGYVRSAREGEVLLSQNLLLDLDFADKSAGRRELDGLEGLFARADEYFVDAGLRPPVRAVTGGGYHLLCAYPPVRVAEVGDIGVRLRVFRDRFAGEFRRDLGALELQLDRTQDLRRMVRVYGTAKPNVGLLSKFYGGERVEDEGLRDYLLGLTVPERMVGCAAAGGLVGRELPAWFSPLLEGDVGLRRLWLGQGKPEGLDVSSSGYDHTLVKRLLQLGYTDVAELATILARRPDGSVRKRGRDDGYIRRTIAAALLK